MLDSILCARGAGMNPNRCPFDAYILVGKAGREFLAEGTVHAKVEKRSSIEQVKGASRTGISLWGSE